MKSTCCVTWSRCWRPCVTCLQNGWLPCPLVIDPVTGQADQWWLRWHWCGPGVCRDADKLCVMYDVSDLLTQMFVQIWYCCLPQIVVARERISCLYQRWNDTLLSTLKDRSLSAIISATARQNRTDHESLKSQALLQSNAVAATCCCHLCQLSSDRWTDGDAPWASWMPSWPCWRWPPHDTEALQCLHVTCELSTGFTSNWSHTTLRFDMFRHCTN